MNQDLNISIEQIVRALGEKDLEIMLLRGRVAELETEKLDKLAYPDGPFKPETK